VSIDVVHDRGASRIVLLVAALCLVGGGIAWWRLESGSAASNVSIPTTKVTRGDIVVSVGGVGRIVETLTPTSISVPGGSGGGSGAAPGTGTAPGDGVFAQASGHVSRLLVGPGSHVVAGQPIAVVDDGGAAIQSQAQAENDLAAADLELAQKQHQDPLRGFPPTAQEVAAAQYAVTAARVKLAHLLAPPKRADVDAAEADVLKTQADYQTLLRGTRPADVAAAEADVSKANADYQTLLRGTRPADVAAAEADVSKANADYQTLLRGTRPADVAAAQADVEKAQADYQNLLGGTKAARKRAIAVARENLKAANARLAKLYAPATPADIASAQADLQKARADMAALLAVPPPPTQAAIDAAQQAVNATQMKYDQLIGPGDSIAISNAIVDLKRAQSDLADLKASKASSAAIDAAQATVDNAQLKLDTISGPRDPVEIANALTDLKRAQADLANLTAPHQFPSAEALSAGQQAINAAKARLTRLKHSTPSPGDVETARADVAHAHSDLRTLLAGPTPSSLAAGRAAIRAANTKLALLRAGATPSSLAAGRAAIKAANVKLALLRAGATPSSLAAGRAAIRAANTKLALLRAGATPSSLAAGRGAIKAAKAKLALVRAPATPSDVDAAKLDVRRAQADLAALLARNAPASPIDQNITRLKIAAAKLRINAARHSIGMLTVRAPYSGTVTSVLTRVGAPVDGTTPVATVADLTHLGVEVGLSEFDVAAVKVGQPALISVDALGGRKFGGRVVSVALTGTDTGGGVIAYPVRISMRKVPNVQPGMNVSVRIVVAARRNVLQVPLEAVSRNDEDRPVVTLVNGAGITKLRRVQLGLANNKNVQIVTGLRQGQRLVLAPAEEGGD
jgi:RND family efflux transporter MFP subunit